MHKLFGKPKAAPPAAATTAGPSTTAAMAETGDTLELIVKRESHVQRLVANEVAAAREAAAANNQKVALEHIKRKKIHEKELERLSVQKLNLFQQEQTLHALQFNSIVVHSQEHGAAAIEKEIQRSGGIDGTERVLDRMQDAMDDARDLLEVGNRKMGEAADLDDEELLEELEQLELLDELTRTEGGAARAPDKEASVSTARPVPAPVPTTDPMPARERAKRAEEERDLAELAALQRSMLVMETPMPMPQMAACC